MLPLCGLDSGREATIRPTASCGPKRQRRTAAKPQGKKVGEAVAGQGPVGIRPARREAIQGGFQHQSHENDDGHRPFTHAFGISGAIRPAPCRGLSPFPDPRPCTYHLTSGRRRCGRSIIQPAAASAQEDETTLDDGVRSHAAMRSPTRFPRGGSGASLTMRSDHHGLTTALSITTPALTYSTTHADDSDGGHANYNPKLPR
jgi:hypothetical protein